MITEECMKTVLPVVADSWEQLRRCDVYRLIDSIHYEEPDSLFTAGDIVKAKCPQFSDEVDDCVQEIREIRGW